MHIIPLYLITGFLGSGKTTFLKEVIAYFGNTKKIAIVQNEFAPANIDGDELKRTVNEHFELLEVNNGSVFCVCLLSGFVQSLARFVDEYQPDVILMEASGLSDPVSVGQIFGSSLLKEKVYLEKTISIVDANNYGRFNTVLTQLKHQLMIADDIIINKTDISPNTDPIIVSIRKINPFGKIYFSSYCKIELSNIFNEEIKKNTSFYPSHTSQRPDIASVVFKSVKPIQNIRVGDFLNELSAKSYRVKGYLYLDNGSLLAIQCVANDINAEIIENVQKRTEFIAIGPDINIDYISNLYQNMSN